MLHKGREETHGGGRRLGIYGVLSAHFCIPSRPMQMGMQNDVFCTTWRVYLSHPVFFFFFFFQTSPGFVSVDGCLLPPSRSGACRQGWSMPIRSFLKIQEPRNEPSTSCLEHRFHPIGMPVNQVTAADHRQEARFTLVGPWGINKKQEPGSQATRGWDA